MEQNIWKKDFPQLQNSIVYLDSAAMSLKPNTVVDQVHHYYNDLSVNIHRGFYPTGLETSALYESTRETVASYIGCSEEEIVFTRGTTASLNLVAFSYGLNSINEGDEIITSELEHHSNLLPWMEVAKKKNAKLVYIPLTEEGRITVEAFKSVLSSKTKVVALTYVSNVMGYITPIEEITKLAHEVGAIVSVDGAQALPHLRINVRKLDIDFLAFSGHKMLGPTGVGVLYGKHSLLDKMAPTEFGGDMNDIVNKFDAVYKDVPYRFESGTMPVASVIGLKNAIDYLNQVGIETIEDYQNKVYRYALARLSKIEGVEIYNPNSDTAIISFNLKDVPPHDAVSYYSEKNICMRSGQHCAKLVSDFLGIQGCLRASFYIYNDYKDVDQFIDVTKEAIAFFKRMGF
ncbi:MAG: aminotransferase class V-fold PLP-dependent enzyme [Candidatus Izemoplasmatales bacterium]